MVRPDSHPVLRPALRLVGTEGVRPEPEPPRRAREAVARENRAAAGLSDGDARRIFALRVEGALDGGRAAVLSPDRRRELVAGAVAGGLRPFEANLVIAIVQDGVRHGERGVGEKTGSLLALVRRPEAERGAPVAAIVWAIAIAMLLVMLAVSWVLRG